MIVSQFKLSYIVAFFILLLIIITLGVFSVLVVGEGPRDLILMILLTTLLIIFFYYTYRTYKAEINDEGITKSFSFPFYKKEISMKWKSLEYVYSVFPLWVPYKIFIFGFENRKTVTFGSMVTNTDAALKKIHDVFGWNCFDDELEKYLRKRL